MRSFTLNLQTLTLNRGELRAHSSTLNLQTLTHYITARAQLQPKSAKAYTLNHGALRAPNSTLNLQTLTHQIAARFARPAPR